MSLKLSVKSIAISRFFFQLGWFLQFELILLQCGELDVKTQTANVWGWERGVALSIEPVAVGVRKFAFRDLLKLFAFKLFLQCKITLTEIVQRIMKLALGKAISVPDSPDGSQQMALAAGSPEKGKRHDEQLR